MGAPKPSRIPSKEFIEFHWLQLNLKLPSLPGHVQPIWRPCFGLTEGSWSVLFFRKLTEFKETLIGQCIILLRAITPLLLSCTHSIHTEEMNCINTQLETMAQLWLTLGLGLIHNWVSQSCFALYVGNKHLMYFSGAGTIWDEQASACSFRHSRSWTLDLWWHHHDQSPASWLPRTKQNLNILRIANMKNVPSVGLEFFQLIFCIWFSWNSPPTASPQKIDVSMKVLSLIFFFSVNTAARIPSSWLVA